MNCGLTECPYILLVEDDEQVRFIINEYLRDVGYQVDVAGTVAAACSLLADSRDYNLVITDGRLPDGNGLMIAQRASEQSLKVIIISGFPQELAAAERAQYTVLAKPFRLSVLSKAVSDTLSATAWDPHYSRAKLNA
jgi:DNA-binding NtrC family response regulator